MLSAKQGVSLVRLSLRPGTGGAEFEPGADTKPLSWFTSMKVPDITLCGTTTENTEYFRSCFLGELWVFLRMEKSPTLDDLMIPFHLGQQSFLCDKCCFFCVKQKHCEATISLLETVCGATVFACVCLCLCVIRALENVSPLRPSACEQRLLRMIWDRCVEYCGLVYSIFECVTADNLVCACASEKDRERH